MYVEPDKATADAHSIDLVRDDLERSLIIFVEGWLPRLRQVTVACDKEGRATGR